MLKFENEIEIFLTKVSLMLPAILAVMFKLAIDAKKRRFKIINASVSMFVGVGSSYLISPYVLKNFSTEAYPIIIGFTAISADKFFEWLLMKIEDMKIFDILFSPILNYFKNIFKK